MTRRAYNVAIEYEKPDTQPLVLDPADDYFETESLDTTGSRFAGATPWEWLNQDGATAEQQNGVLVLRVDSAATSALRGVQQVLTGSSWRYRAKLSLNVREQDQYATVALFIGDSMSGGVTMFGMGMLSGDLYYNGWIWVSPISFSASFVSYKLNGANTQYFELELADSVLHCRVSATGADGSFIEIRSVALADTFTMNPDRIGILINTDETESTVGQATWFRRMA